MVVSDIDLFQSSDKYTSAVGHREEWVVRTPLKELEEQLDPVSEQQLASELSMLDLATCTADGRVSAQST